jgi:hypothetical protein
VGQNAPCTAPKDHARVVEAMRPPADVSAMREARWLLLFVLVGCSGKDASQGGATLTAPKIYPPIRAGTPTGLIADPAYAAPVAASEIRPLLRLVAPTAADLAMVVRDRIYTPGPTEILRVVHEVDDRVRGLELRLSEHECLGALPRTISPALPAGASFPLRLQCLQTIDPTLWIAFGFDEAQAGAGDPDAGTVAVRGGRGYFYLLEGQSTGNGGAYRVDRATGDVEGWVAVADSSLPLNSQVVLHLATDVASSSLEMVFGGSGVGFCRAHLKTSPDFIFVSGKTNAPPPPGGPMAGQYCDDERSGCFASGALGTDLGAGSASCASIAAGTFALSPELDAATSGGNVNPSAISAVFSTPPAVPAF